MSAAVLETVVGWGLVSTLILAPVAIAAWFLVRGRRTEPGWTMDMRDPGEAFCAKCPDHEACATGLPCGLVRITEIRRQARR